MASIDGEPMGDEGGLLPEVVSYIVRPTIDDTVPVLIEGVKFWDSPHLA